MPSSFVLFQILLSGKPLARGSVAAREWTEERFFGRRVHLVDFTLVPQQPTRIRESLRLFTARLRAFVGSLMSVHVLIPLTRPTEYLQRLCLAFGMIAVDFATRILWRTAISTNFLD